MPEFKRIRYDVPESGVARVTLCRAEESNYQDLTMLYEIDKAYKIAVADDAIRVIILAAQGPDFSLGHDTFTEDWWNPSSPDKSKFDPVTEYAGGYDEPGHAGHFNMEQEFYLGLCWRWRNLPKPTIAQVQGRVFNGGLMISQPCDIMVAADNARFCEIELAVGVPGNEYFVHAWEYGHRKAKEMLFTGEPLTAEELLRLGAVNHVVPLDSLENFTLKLAKRIATRPSFGLRLAKMAVNQSLDAQGQWTALQSAYSLHHIGHANELAKHQLPLDTKGFMSILRQDIEEFGATHYADMIDDLKLATKD